MCLYINFLSNFTKFLLKNVFFALISGKTKENSIYIEKLPETDYKKKIAVFFPRILLNRAELAAFFPEISIVHVLIAFDFVYLI